MEESSNQKVVIDADFFRNATEHEIGTALFEKLMSDNNYLPVMHQYVSSVELKGDEKLGNLIKSRKIEVISDSDYLSANDEDYKTYFLEMYERLNGVEFGDEDILIYGYDGQRWRESLGEIRSAYLAYVKGFGLLLSDDHGAWEAANYLSSSKHKIDVKRLYDLLISNPQRSGSLRWRDIKYTVEKVYCSRKQQMDELRRLYNLDAMRQE